MQGLPRSALGEQTLCGRATSLPILVLTLYRPGPAALGAPPTPPVCLRAFAHAVCSPQSKLNITPAPHLAKPALKR